MYSAILTVHSYLRYAVLLMVLLAVLRYVAGLLHSRAWNDGDEGAGRDGRDDPRLGRRLRGPARGRLTFLAESTAARQIRGSCLGWCSTFSAPSCSSGSRNR